MIRRALRPIHRSLAPRLRAPSLSWSLALPLALLLVCLSFGCQPKSGEEGLYGEQTYGFGSGGPAAGAEDQGRDASPPASGQGQSPDQPADRASGAPGGYASADMAGALVIPARSRAEWTAKGNCLDPDRPAPRHGDRFRLVPASAIIDADLLPLYEGFINLTAHDAEARQYQQQIVWAMRTVNKRNSYATSLGARQKALLDKSLPGGAALFEEVRVSRAGQPGVGDFLAGLLPRVSFFGISIDLGELLDPDTAPAVADNQLEQLINMPVEGGASGGREGGGVSPTGSLGQGIDTRITGTAPLTMRISITNNTDRDYVFVPARYAAEAQRKVQRLTVAPPEGVSISRL